MPASFLQRAKRVALSAAAVAVPLSLVACSPSSNGASASDDDHRYPELHENMGAAPYRPDHEIDDGDAGDGGVDGARPDGGESDASPDGDAGTDAEIPITPI